MVGVPDLLVTGFPVDGTINMQLLLNFLLVKIRNHPSIIGAGRIIPSSRCPQHLIVLLEKWRIPESLSSSSK